MDILETHTISTFRAKVMILDSGDFKGGRGVSLKERANQDGVR